MLADQGAEVIKVENPAGGDSWQVWPRSRLALNITTSSSIARTPLRCEVPE
ncbi:CoA transferase [Marinobacter daqiaonensis]|nr:CoA transferase [Marinobacter daqiaonensis]